MNPLPRYIANMTLEHSRDPADHAAETTPLITKTPTACDMIIRSTSELVFVAAVMCTYIIGVVYFCRGWYYSNCHHPYVRGVELFVMLALIAIYIATIIIVIYATVTDQVIGSYDPTEHILHRSITGTNFIFVVAMFIIPMMLSIAKDYISHRCEYVVAESEVYILFLGACIMLLVLLCVTGRRYD